MGHFSFKERAGGRRTKKGPRQQKEKPPRRYEAGTIAVSRDMRSAFEMQEDGSWRRIPDDEAYKHIEAAKTEFRRIAVRGAMEEAIAETMEVAMQPVVKPPSGLVDSQGKPVEETKPGTILGPDGRPV